MNRYALILALAFTGCTHLRVNPKTGELDFMTGGDWTNLSLTVNGVTLSGNATHSVIYTATGGMVGNIAGSVGSAVVGYRLASTATSGGTRVLGALAPTGSAISNRHTNRVVATPQPTKLLHP